MTRVGDGLGPEQPLETRARDARCSPAEDGPFEACFRRLFDARFPSVFRYLVRAGASAALAEEVAQDAFMKLYARGRMPDRPEQWLITVAHNRFRDSRRKRSRRLRLLESRTPEFASADPPAAPDAGAARREERLAVRTALERLPERERRLLLLREEGYSYRQLAEMIGVAETSVGSLLLRARRAFRSAFEESAHAHR